MESILIFLIIMAFALGADIQVFGERDTWLDEKGDRHWNKEKKCRKNLSSSHPRLRG